MRHRNRSVSVRAVSLLAAALLVLAACGGGDDGDTGSAQEASEESADTDTDPDDASDADEAADDGPEDPDDEAAQGDDRASITLDGEPMTSLAGTFQCAGFPDGSITHVGEFADPAAGADDPRARIGLSVREDADGEQRVAVNYGMDLETEVHASYEVLEPGLDLDEDSVSFTDLELELRELNYDLEPDADRIVLTADIDCR